MPVEKFVVDVEIGLWSAAARTLVAALRTASLKMFRIS